MQKTDTDASVRQQWLRELAHAEEDRLRDLLDTIVNELSPDVLELRSPEVGLTLVTGRVGGTGAPFGLGEMTLTRCVVQVDDAIGVGYVSGRSPEHARRVALADALLQGQHAARVDADVIEPLRADRAERNGRQTAEAEATRVQFLTMVRGN